MKKQVSAQERIARVFPVLLNVGMMLALPIGSAAFPTNARAASTITVTSIADNVIANGFCIFGALEQPQVIKFS